MDLFAGDIRRNHNKEINDVPAIVFVSGEDKAMAWAVEKAGLTLWYFIESLSNPLPEQSCFAVKIKIRNEKYAEHIWLTDPEFDQEGNLFGTVGNEPGNVTSVRMGDRIGVESSLVSDWMMIESGRLIGGYSIRAFRDSIPENEQRAFDDAAGLFIDEGADYFKVNFDTPEGAILSIEQYFSENNLDLVLLCKDFHAEAKLVLDKTDLEPDYITVAVMAEALRASFLQYIEKEGMPDFSMKTSAFTNREKINDDYWIITEICVYPDGYRSVERIYTYKSPNGWRVLGTVPHS
jgi:uncharacterized protein YegJ (DUF2314 family)